MIDLRPYRPSNGTEGEMFIARWCVRCRREGAREPEGLMCDILSRTFAYPLDHPEYPAEWVMDGREPRCTAFEDEKCHEPLDPAAVLRPLL